MVNKAKIKQRQYAQWDSNNWFRGGEGRGKPGLAACFDCKTWAPWTQNLCVYGNCDEFYCGSCGKFSGGAGPIGCPCDNYGNCSGGRGHRTRKEQVGVHYKLAPNPDPDSFMTFVVNPIKKRKPSKRRHR